MTLDRFGIGMRVACLLSDTECMKRLPALIASVFSIGAIPLSSLPVHSIPNVSTFSLDGVGFFGCQGVAGKRGDDTWDGLKFAAWEFGNNQKRTMVMNLDGALRSFAYNRRSVDTGKEVSVQQWGEWGKYKILMQYRYTKPTERNQKMPKTNGAIRIYSDKPGDSLSIPITLKTGC